VGKRLLSFAGKGHEPFANKCIGFGGEGWTYGVEIWTDNDDTGNKGCLGQRYYSWAMPVYADDGGHYISFKRTHLKDILGKHYIKDIPVVVADKVCYGAREVIPRVVC